MTVVNVDGGGTVVDVTVAAEASFAPERSGCTAVTLTDDQAAALAAAQAQPHGGLTFDGTSFTALPVAAPATPVNANQALMTALAAIPVTDGGYNVAQAVLKVLQGQPSVPAV